MKDIVAQLVIKTRNGQEYRVPIARQGDPVEGLDKTLRFCRIRPTAISSLHCTAFKPEAVTVRAVEAVVGVFKLLKQIPRPSHFKR